jgi:hypothetical protein
MNQRVGHWLVARDRGRLVHWLVLKTLPRAISMRFDPSSAENLEATLELAIRDPRGRQPARYELAIRGAQCNVRPGPPSRPAARATIGSGDLIMLVSGAVGWPQLLSSGRFELTGDPFLALRFASLFRLPVVLDPV